MVCKDTLFNANNPIEKKMIYAYVQIASILNSREFIYISDVKIYNELLSNLNIRYQYLKVA